MGVQLDDGKAFQEPPGSAISELIPIQSPRPGQKWPGAGRLWDSAG